MNKATIEPDRADQNRLLKICLIRPIRFICVSSMAFLSLSLCNFTV
jgi:hypothetical protein